jgi:mRNA deadenylase 3'-5' endonuclease subunit Ccr4
MKLFFFLAASLQTEKIISVASFLKHFIHFCCCCSVVLPARRVAPLQMNPSVSNVMKLRVVSYNLLSSHLSSPSYYTTINPDYLDPSKRLTVVIKKIENEIKESNDERPTIFALQEVSYDWAGALHTFFANRGYHLTTGLYGQRFNGYVFYCIFVFLIVEVLSP